ncbi:MAG: sigma-54 dependent transcriptional regulator [Thermodesulfovibrionales bacterium]|nr:sigma-54 dependent transcriptional regulator [Thermodesulfovibrionales bacterium]
MNRQRVLIVDDDRNLLELLRIRLDSAGYEVFAAPDEETAMTAVCRNFFDLSIVDLNLVHSDGISLMEKLHAVYPDMPVIILTAYGSIESAVEGMRRGAFNYLTKPFDPRALMLQIELALEKKKLTREIKRLKGLLYERYDFKNIVAKSAGMRQVLEQVSLVARTESTIFIYGESGTGKELIAKAIHLASERRDNPFVAINCAAIPETLLESELFGYEKGAFSGAFRASKGLLVQADQGTIFLDEIGDMPLSMQVKILRFLQERQFYAIGSQIPAEVDVRVIVATNKDLQKLIREGKFREDLFYRIHVIPIHLPPLRERKEDIPLLAEHFLSKCRQQMNKELKGFSADAMQQLMLFDWPGNIRELENTIEYAAAMAKHDIITDHLIFQSGPKETLKTFRESRAQFEEKYLSNLLHLTRGNVTRAAKLAGRYRADLYNLIRKYNIDTQKYKDS